MLSQLSYAPIRRTTGFIISREKCFVKSFLKLYVTFLPYFIGAGRYFPDFNLRGNKTAFWGRFLNIPRNGMRNRRFLQKNAEVSFHGRHFEKVPLRYAKSLYFSQSFTCPALCPPCRKQQNRRGAYFEHSARVLKFGKGFEIWQGF